jgi:hypothetical protein
MRTLEVKLYKYDELSEEAKKKAIESKRGECAAYHEECIADDYIGTLKAFEKLLDIRIDVKDDRGRTWFSPKFNDDSWCYMIDTEDGSEYLCLEELSGKLLQRYIRNNIMPYLVKPRTFYRGDYKKQRKSRIMYDDAEASYPLTGVCCDYEVIQPIVDYMKHPDNDTTMEDLIQKSVDALADAYGDDVDWGYSDEAVEEELNLNEYEFLEDGTPY